MNSIYIIGYQIHHVKLSCLLLRSHSFKITFGLNNITRVLFFLEFWRINFNSILILKCSSKFIVAENSSGLGSISCTAVQFTVIRIWHLGKRGMFLLIILHLTGSH